MRTRRQLAAGHLLNAPAPAQTGRPSPRGRAQWCAGRPLWVAGSTHAGEETICLAAQRHLLGVACDKGSAPPLLALAPRHPERFDEVARELSAAGFAFARSSQPSRQGAPAPAVLLIDEMGALLGWYAAADVAFVGGSLVPAGGHNLIEPAMLVVMGVVIAGIVMSLYLPLFQLTSVIGNP